MGAGAGHLHVRAVTQGLRNQAVKLLIAQPRPPFLFGPGGGGDADVFEGVTGLQVLGIKADALGVQPVVIGTASQHH